MKKINYKKLIFQILFPFVLGGIVGFLTKEDYSYVESLDKSINIPNYIFIIVWSVLYLMMGLWAYLYDRDYPNDSKTMNLYYISILVNILFTPILFSMHNLVLALIDVLILIGIVLYLLIKTLKNKKKYGYLLLPYFVWLFVALTLMLDLILHNI